MTVIEIVPDGQIVTVKLVSRLVFPSTAKIGNIVPFWHVICGRDLGMMSCCTHIEQTFGKPQPRSFFN